MDPNRGGSEGLHERHSRAGSSPAPPSGELMPVTKRAWTSGDRELRPTLEEHMFIIFPNFWSYYLGEFSIFILTQILVLGHGRVDHNHQLIHSSLEHCLIPVLPEILHLLWFFELPEIGS
jgi:hypothetical protein